MADELAGFPYWEFHYDERGAPVGSRPGDGATDPDGFVTELPRKDLSDLFVFAHGWNNREAMARHLYSRFFEQLRVVLEGTGASANIGVAGIFWPSMRWPDESVPTEGEGGAASQLDAGPSDAAVFADLRAVYSAPAAQEALDEVEDLLARRPADHDALQRFHAAAAILAGPPEVIDVPEDGGERALVEASPEDVFAASADLAPEDRMEGALGLGDKFDGLWAGARQVLRQASYWQMKKRAGVVGMNGLGPLISGLGERSEIRIHLIGHSFGARLVSYALTRLARAGISSGSPVKSVMLVQGAFSHFAFADALPHAPGRPGGLAGMERRIDGPLIATHSPFDLAVGNLYPWASIAGRDDAAALEDLLYRWGAIGHDGAQASDAIEGRLLGPGEAYVFERGRIFNLDASDVIVEGDPPSGAHSDIFHPELAWTALSASAIV